MPGSTPIYGFPYPEPSDLVANYPALGQDLAEDVENVLVNIGGFVLINTSSFTTASSVIVNSVFTTTYQNYRIVLATDDPATAQTFTMRLRASGTDNSSSNYYRLCAGQNAGGAVSVTGQTTSFFINFAGNGSQCTSSFDVFRPQQATRTTLAGESVGNNVSFTGITGWSIAGWFDLASQFDGFSMLFGANTTGIVRTYGYKNS